MPSFTVTVHSPNFVMSTVASLSLTYATRAASCPPRQTRRRALETEYRMMCDFFFRERVPWRACRYCHRWHVSRRTRLYCGSTGCHFNKMRSYANTRLGSVNGSPYNNRFRFMPYPWNSLSTSTAIAAYSLISVGLNM